MAENFFGITDPGKLRTNNEDTFIAQPVGNNKFIAACVIDGVGGYEGGEIAAHLAHDTILSHINNLGSADIIEVMKDALIAANEAIYKEKQISKQNKQMACVLTLALADLASNKFYYAHVGDTRLYLLRDNSLVKVTRDHSFVGFLEDNGRLSEEAAMRHPKRNEIDKALGFGSEVKTADYIETGESPFLPGDTILLCSDGLSDMIDNNAMISILTLNKSLSFKGKALINAANAAGGKDNITVVLVENNKIPLQHTATKPAMTIKQNDDTDKERPEEAKSSSVEKIKVEKIKKGSSSAPLFTFLGVLILVTLLWLVYQNYTNRNGNNSSDNSVRPKKRNEQEQLLIDSINAAKTNEVFVLNQPGNPAVEITDSVFINKDSLHIIGNGVTIKSAAAYKGPGFTISPSCKYVLLDSLTLENFDIGVFIRNPGLHLKNVYFRNCRVPVQYQPVFKDSSVVNGRFADTLFYNSEANSQ